MGIENLDMAYNSWFITGLVLVKKPMGFPSMASSSWGSVVMQSADDSKTEMVCRWLY
jgi:hypothetical protein